MSGDILERAAAALREEHDGSSPSAGATEMRILAKLGKRPRPAWRMRILLPIAATLVGSAAWAAGTGRLRPTIAAIEHAVFERHEEERAPPRVASPPPLPAPRVNPAPSDVAPPSSAPPTVAVPVPSSSTALAAPVPAPRTPAPSAPAATATVATPPRQTDPDALYRSAHDAHFVRRDPAAALDGWDRYLAVAPNGPLATEARYNRAIALVRLGRDAEAKAALRPFAEGDYGPYRQAEAKSLVDMLDARAH
jgi:hypothetical protein